MEDKKVFRVLMTDTRGFYVDVEASNLHDARKAALTSLDNGQDPMEDESFPSGYVITDIQEIKREDANLD